MVTAVTTAVPEGEIRRFLVVTTVVVELASGFMVATAATAFFVFLAGLDAAEGPSSESESESELESDEPELESEPEAEDEDDDDEDDELDDDLGEMLRFRLPLTDFAAGWTVFDLEEGAGTGPSESSDESPEEEEDEDEDDTLAEIFVFAISFCTLGTVADDDVGLVEATFASFFAAAARVGTGTSGSESESESDEAEDSESESASDSELPDSDSGLISVNESILSSRYIPEESAGGTTSFPVFCFFGWVTCEASASATLKVFHSPKISSRDGPSSIASPSVTTEVAAFFTAAAALGCCCLVRKEYISE